MDKIHSFEECMKDCGERSRNLLLGNGWSINWKSEFSYCSLMKALESELESHPKAEQINIIKISKKLKTTDFERIMQSIKESKQILEILEPEVPCEVEKYLRIIKDCFIKAIKKVHPGSWDEVNQSEETAINFLRKFERYFTTNYDLLLYWLLNKRREDPKENNFSLNDGFTGKKELYFQEQGEQNLYYLHGGLHLFNHATNKRQYKSGSSIIEQLDKMIRDAQHLHYPSIVLEGDGESKRNAINDSPYLHWCHTQFSKIEGSLFIHGFSFKENDAHIYEGVFNNSELEKIYIGLHENDSNTVKFRVREEEKKFRVKKEKIKFYDSQSVNL